MFDDGDVLPGLNESWTFMGANAMEWCCGLCTFVCIGAVASTPAAAMPLMLASWVGTTYTLAAIRRSFPDEERGARNAMMTALGFPPPGIPAPAALQPVWSQARVMELHPESKFRKLGFEYLFPSHVRDLDDPEV